MAIDRLAAVPDRSTTSPVTLVDSNVLLDIITDDPTWARWSGDALTACRDEGTLVINPIIYAEVSVRFSQVEELVFTSARMPRSAVTGC